MEEKKPIIIKEVVTKRDLRKFVDYPNKLYKDVPQFVPAFYGDDLADWNKKKNPAFDYCEARCFLAYRDEKIVGRIGAILSHRSNQTWNTNRMRFSQVDFIDDYEVSKALFDTVEQWAKEKGCDEVHGPLGFCDMDREGMLVEGFERRSMFITYYNHPYYNDHLKRLGYGKDTDWMEQYITLPAEDDPETIRLHRIAEYVMSRKNYHKLNVKHGWQIKQDTIEQAFMLVNQAYAPLYSTVELDHKQVKKYAAKFLPIINPKLLCLVYDENDKMIAFGAVAPSMAKAMQKSRGRLAPFGWMRILHSLKHNDTIDFFLIAVRPDLQGTGVNAIIMDHIIQGAKELGIHFAETGPQLEYNNKVMGQWKNLNALQHKRRRCYIKDLNK